MISNPQPRLLSAFSFSSIRGFFNLSGAKPTPMSWIAMRSSSGSRAPSTEKVMCTFRSGARLCSKELMQASTTAIRTSSILSELIFMDSAIEVAVRLAAISMSGSIGRVSVTSRSTGWFTMSRCRRGLY